MSVLITGIDMNSEEIVSYRADKKFPLGRLVIELYPDGSGHANVFTKDFHKTLRYCKATEIQPHGRLIDADALKDTLDYYIREAGWSDEINEALTWVRDEFIDHEPTIIPEEN